MKGRLEVVGQFAPVLVPEAPEGLELLGRRHPDKAARKAAMQHRSRMANQR